VQSPRQGAGPRGRWQPVDLWSSVDAILDRSTSLGALHHGLGPLAARRLRARGLDVATPLLREERSAAVFAGIAAPLLERIRACCDGPLVLFKGPELACRYPDNARAFSDLDVLTPNAEAVQRALLAAGFVEHTRGLEAPHHRPPLILESLPLKVEVHDSLKWPGGQPGPSAREIYSTGVATLLGIDGVVAPSPAHHALIAAAHSWEHRPLRIMRDMIDVAVVACEADEVEIEALAGSRGLEKIWATTRATCAALFFGRPPTLPLRSWARHLSELRERTVFEAHLERWLSPYWELPVARAVATTGIVLGDEIRPSSDERWRDKALRSVAAVQHAFLPLGTHDSLVAAPADRERDAEQGTEGEPPGN
jgi:Uncharacterised nucleotidyltransferase